MLFTVSLLHNAIFAKDNIVGNILTGADIDFTQNITYSEYFDKHSKSAYPQTSIDMNALNITKSSNMEIQDTYLKKNNVVKYASNGGYSEFEFVASEGNYSVEITYTSKEENNTELVIGVMTDGSYPFDEAQSIALSRAWQDSSKILQDENGNDILPMQKEVQIWQSEMLFDRQGFYLNPYIFNFTAGRHTLRILTNQGNVLISNIRLCNNTKKISYVEYAKDFKTSNNEYKITMEAENTHLKSDSTLYPTIDRTSSKTSPSNPVKLKYNTIGQSNFLFNGQWIEWKIDVKAAGLYKLSYRARQNIARGMNSHRQILIDGKILFKEMQDIVFPFSKDFYFKTLGDKSPFGIYLTSGEHTIKMLVVPSDVASAMRVVNDIVFDLNSIYRQLMMIIGPSPDMFTDYYIDRQIPDLKSRLSLISKKLKEQKTYLDGLSKTNASDSSEIEQMYVMIDNMISKPDTIPFRLAVFQSNISGISAWVSSVSAQPLELDYLLLTGINEKLPDAKGNIFENIAFGVQSIFGSYFEDYSSLGGAGADERIDVWVGLGRDQAQVIKQMTDSFFTPKSGVNVKLSLVQGSVMEATMAGKGPDVALFAGDGMPMNLAARKSLVDLKQFDNFDEIITHFNKSAMTPYMFNGGYYGLPLQQSFPVMFYRKDVLSELGIHKLPDTWDEFYSIIPVIQRANLTLGMGDTNIMQLGVNQAPNFGFMFPSLVFQRDGKFYKDDLTSTDFDNTTVTNAFCDWTNLYTQYNLPLQYDLFNRFRTGEMPIAFAPYTIFNQINFAAPEIKGLWGIASVPGTKDSNNKINKSVAASSSTGAVIFTKAKDKTACFKYISWFASDDMQAVYGRNIETLMGPAARYDTANLAALTKLPWSIKEQKTLIQQQKFVVEVPAIPATYFVNREVTNAFRRVVFDIKDPRETLIFYNREMNKEIIRKDKELGIIK